MAYRKKGQGLGEPYMFRSYDHTRNLSRNLEPSVQLERHLGPGNNTPIWQVARATTAAPT